MEAEPLANAALACGPDPLPTLPAKNLSRDSAFALAKTRLAGAQASVPATILPEYLTFSTTSLV